MLGLKLDRSVRGDNEGSNFIVVEKKPNNVTGGMAGETKSEREGRGQLPDKSCVVGFTPKVLHMFWCNET